MASAKTFQCAPCKCRSISVSAVTYCKTCKEQLCKNCAECHKAFKATRKHLLVRAHDQQSKKMSHDLELFQTCKEHVNKEREFYCGEHDTLLCSLCLLKSETHRNCTRVVDIDTTGKSFLDSKFTDNVIDSYQRMIQSATCTITNIKKAKECTSDNLKSLKIQIENIRRRMMEAFDRQTNHIIHAVSTDLVDNNSRCEKASQSLENLIKLAEGSDGLFQTVIDNGSSTDIFRCVLSMLGQCEEFQKELVQTKRQCSQLSVTVEKSKLVKMLETDHSPLLSCSVNKTSFDITASSSDQVKVDFQKHISSQTVPDIQHRDENSQSVDPETSESKDEGHKHTALNPMKVTREFGNTKLSREAEIDKGLEGSAASRKQISVKKPDSRRETEDIDIELSYCYSFNVSTPDKEIPWFNGIVCLPDERLILSDYNNSRLVMVRNCTEVTEKGWEGDWKFELIALQGQKWIRTTLNIKLTGIYDGHVFAIQHLPEVQDKFHIIQCCGTPGKLQCFHQDGVSPIFQYEVDDTTSLETDTNGYIFVIRHPGEVEVLKPDGTFITSIHRAAMKRLKFSALNQAKDKLYITTFKDSRIHVLDVKRLHIAK